MLSLSAAALLAAAVALLVGNHEGTRSWARLVSADVQAGRVSVEPAAAGRGRLHRVRARPRRRLAHLAGGPASGARPSAVWGGSARAGGADGLASGRARAVASVLATVGAWTLLVPVLGAAAGLALGLGVGVSTHVVLGRAEPGRVVADREDAAAALPLVVELTTAAVRAGAPVSAALNTVCEVLPGPLTAQLRALSAQAAVSADPAAVWAGNAADPVYGSLARAMAAAIGRGVSPVATLERVAQDARASARWAAEGRARSLGAKAAAPLGLCFLPAFVLLGVVPVIAAAGSSLLP